MKRLLTFIVFIGFYQTSFSQSYIPVIELNKFWDQSNEDGYDPCSFSPYRYEFIEGDSIINGFSYRLSKAYPLIGNQGPGTMTCPPYLADTNFVLFACLREDTLARKVYIYDEFSNPKDQLLYDFTLSIGDTLKSDYAGQGTVLILDTIEIVTLENGEARRKYVFNEDWISYMEGIGGSNGLFLPLYMPESNGTTLYCVKKNGEDLFGTICNTVFVGIKNEPEISISIFPNPATEIINIDLKTRFYSQSIQFELFDLKGIKILTKEITISRNSISLKDIIPGFYIFRVMTEMNLYYGSLFKI